MAAPRAAGFDETLLSDSNNLAGMEMSIEVSKLRHLALNSFICQ